MKILYSLDELLAIRTNGWACECGRTWLDVGQGVSALVAEGDRDHRHRKLKRAVIR